MERLSQGCVLGVGQPLLDYLTHVNDDIYMKYELEKDNAILDNGKHTPLYEELVKRYDVHYEAGGAGLNTIRMIQWILKKPYACAFVGCVGVDDAADILRTECDRVGVRVKFFPVNDGVATGKCAVLVKDKFRSMVTHLGASKELTLEQVRSNDVWPMVERARLFYSTVSPVNNMVEYANAIMFRVICSTISTMELKNWQNMQTTMESYFASILEHPTFLHL